MARWILDQWDETLDYPTLGFIAEPDDILIATAAPDGRWSLNGDQGAAETVTRYTIGGDPSYVEPGDGHYLRWSDEENAYVPAAPVDILSDPDFAADLSTSIDGRILEYGSAVVVEHLDDPDYERPDVLGQLIWLGSVRPVNMVGGDIWLVATEQAVEPPVAYLMDLDASTLALADLDPVASWTDRSGNGHNATQSSPSKRPTFHVASGGVAAFVRGDGADDALLTAAMAAVGQPLTIIAGFRMTSITTASIFKSVFSSIASGANLLTMRQRGVASAARFEAYAGSSGGILNVFNPVAGQWYVMTIVHNGASSTVRINGTATTFTGNPGTNTPTGFALFSSYTGTSDYGDCDIAAFKVFPGILPNVSDVENALMTRLGII